MNLPSSLADKITLAVLAVLAAALLWPVLVAVLAILLAIAVGIAALVVAGCLLILAGMLLIWPLVAIFAGYAAYVRRPRVRTTVTRSDT